MSTTTTETITKECTCHKFIRLHDGNCAVHGRVRKVESDEDSTGESEADNN